MTKILWQHDPHNKIKLLLNITVMLFYDTEPLLLKYDVTANVDPFLPFIRLV